MIISVHCFAYKASLFPRTFSFPLGSWEVSLVATGKSPKNDLPELTLYMRRKMSTDEIELYKKKPGPGEDVEQLFSARSRIYTEHLNEAAKLIEGLLTVFHHFPAPKFDTSKPTVNLYGETEEESALLENDMIRGFGTLSMPEQYPEYAFSDKMSAYIASAQPHLPALTFMSQARRSLVSADHEVAFSLYFRILDGYFADGSSRVELAFVENQDELKKYLPYHPDLITALSTILTDKKLTTKSKIDFKGLIEDLVLLRHKSTHFSATKPASFFNPQTWHELEIVNRFLDQTCARRLGGALGATPPPPEEYQSARE